MSVAARKRGGLKPDWTVVFVLLALGLNIALWNGSSAFLARWTGVPPVPAARGAMIMGLGDTQFSYRLGAMTLQNLGTSPGQVVNIRDYDYQALGQWFWLLHELDAASDNVPMQAAYFFGGTRVPDDAAIVTEYLATIGQNPVGIKWRWLAHAVYLAQYRMRDKALALDLAYLLSRMDLRDDYMPLWARQMPATVLATTGEAAAARQLVENMLLDDVKWHPREIESLRLYLTENLGVPHADVDRLIAERQERGIEDATEWRDTLPAPTPGK